MKKYDFFIVGIALVVGFSALIITDAGSKKAVGVLQAHIYVEGELYKTIDLSSDTGDIEIKTPYGTNILSVFPDGVKMTYSDCPSGVCVKTRKLTVSGSVISCMPHRILIKLTGKCASEVDIIAG